MTFGGIMLQNLHTHCTFCDGKDTPREMIERAIDLGFDSIGFSSHASTPRKSNCELGERADAYHGEISRLKGEYADRIKIFLGTELDVYSAGCYPDFPYDYKIGSAHLAMYGGQFITYDLSYESSVKCLTEYLGGDRELYVKLYFETLADMKNRIDFDFVGHFDLLTKFSEKHPDFIDIESKKYKSLAIEALAALREGCEFFEVNTGAIGRGHRTTPYPAPFILREMRERGCKLILSSDCHNRDFLDCHFGETKEYLLANGISELYYLTDKGFVGEKI